MRTIQFLSFTAEFDLDLIIILGYRLENWVITQVMEGKLNSFFIYLCLKSSLLAA
jgi:hypothetical protein